MSVEKVGNIVDLRVNCYPTIIIVIVLLEVSKRYWGSCGSGVRRHGDNDYFVPVFADLILSQFHRISNGRFSNYD